MKKALLYICGALFVTLGLASWDAYVTNVRPFLKTRAKVRLTPEEEAIRGHVTDEEVMDAEASELSTCAMG